MIDVLEAKRTKRTTSTVSTVATCNELPATVVVGAIKYAQAVQGTSHLIPQEEMFRQIYDEMGWKHESDMD